MTLGATLDTWGRNPHRTQSMKLLASLAAAALVVTAGPAHAWQQPAADIAAEVAKCDAPPAMTTSQNAVNLTYSALTFLNTLHRSAELTSCWESQVRLFCNAGRCGVFFNSGKYGYDPTACSQVRINDRVWSWCGNQPAAIAFAMWPHLVDGAEVATRIARWPGQMTNFREVPVQVRSAKIATYNASLGAAR